MSRKLTKSRPSLIYLDPDLQYIASINLNGTCVDPFWQVLVSRSFSFVGDEGKIPNFLVGVPFGPGW
jgi:hypothetical protein